MPHPDQHHNHNHNHDQAELLDLDAEVLAEHIASIVAWLPVAASPEEIADLGAGTGAGTFALLARFPAARVTAIDAEPAHLRRLAEKARAAGVSDHVRTVAADLDAAAWPDLGTPDLVWASAAMHHMADPARVLRQVRDMLSPGGLIAVVELAGFPRFLPADAPAGRPGLEERCHAAVGRFHAEHVPHRGADWGPLLARAGFVLEAQRTVSVSIEHPDDATVGRYALQSLRRMRTAAAGALAAEDLAALDRLLDTGGPDCVLHRDDLAVRTERTVWAGRRA